MVVSVCQPDVSVIASLLSLAEIRFVRGVGRTSRGLRAQQITSRAAGGPSRSVAPNQGRRAITRGQHIDARRHKIPSAKAITAGGSKIGSITPTTTGKSSNGRPSEPIKKPVAPTNHPIHPAPLQRVHSSKATPESERRRQKTNSILGPTPKSEVVTKNMPRYALKRVGMNMDFWRWGYSDMTLPTSTTLAFKGCHQPEYMKDTRRRRRRKMELIFLPKS